MTLIDDVVADLEALLEPVAGEAPAGVDLDGTLELNALELASAEPETAVVKGVELEDDRNWREIRGKAGKLLQSSKDLRVAVTLTRSLLQQEGFTGYCAGVCFVSELAQRYWDAIYPQLDPVEGDAITRINALQELVSGPMLEQLRVATLFDAEKVGKVTVNDLLLAATHPLGRPELMRSPSHLVFAAIEALGGGARAQLQLLREAREQLAALSQLVADKTGLHLQLGSIVRSAKKDPAGLLDAVDETLSAELARLDKDAAQASAKEQDADDGETSRGRSGDITRREDVIAMLERICAYYARVEPSSPVPLLLQRAKRLATMDFLEIIRDLADQGLPQVGAIAGVSIPGVSMNGARVSSQDEDEHGQVY
jgi:type VI secretion system protein ImpA